jgi:hypothetical protein
MPRRVQYPPDGRAIQAGADRQLQLPLELATSHIEKRLDLDFLNV